MAHLLEMDQLYICLFAQGQQGKQACGKMLVTDVSGESESGTVKIILSLIDIYYFKLWQIL